MQRRYDELRSTQQISVMESITGKLVPDAIKKKLNNGASEIDLVRSGLDDSMRLAFQEIKETRDSHDNIYDLRTAAYVNAIRKISRSYLDIGIY
jgi:glutamate dehydrogenase (NAD(P)+)